MNKRILKPISETIVIKDLIVINIKNIIRYTHWKHLCLIIFIYIDFN